MELGVLSEQEAHELLRAGFLLPDDDCWTEASERPRPLAQRVGESTSVAETPGLLRRAKSHLTAATGAVADATGNLTRKLGSLARTRKAQLTLSTGKLLEDFIPQLQKIISRQLLEKPAQAARTAVRDEVLMRKVFGAAYDCLPKPVYRFVTEPAFIQFCLDHRRRLLKLDDGPLTSNPLQKTDVS